jgi:hypothetical protein
MWKLIVVADALTVIVCVAVKTCLMSITVESLPPTATSVAKSDPPIDIVKVPAAALEFAITMLVTTVVVDAGVVYTVVADPPTKTDPRNKVFDTVAINYYLQIKL